MFCECVVNLRVTRSDRLELDDATGSYRCAVHNLSVRVICPGLLVNVGLKSAYCAYISFLGAVLLGVTVDMWISEPFSRSLCGVPYFASTSMVSSCSSSMFFANLVAHVISYMIANFA